MSKFIAFYLPQFHPIPENDKWYGKGFTEWTNVAKARPLFHGHYQPHVPSELGFYDLRLQEVRQQQASMANECGLTAFCYWNYWFQDGKQLLEKPLWDVYQDKSIIFPFCIAWANHSWEKKLWDNKSSNEVLMEQKYLGEEDYKKYFYSYLPIFKDKRYLRINGKLFFVIWDPLIPQIKDFIKTWRELAKIEGLDDFYFVGKDSAGRNFDRILEIGFNSTYDDNVFNIHHNLSITKKISLHIGRKYFGKPTVFKYKDAIKFMITPEAKMKGVIPVIAPNWDHSPRSGRNAILLDDCDPKYFYRIARKASDMVALKEDEDIVIIKSWNEWGEGNHMEPDLKYGRGYLDALNKVVSEGNNV